MVDPREHRVHMYLSTDEMTAIDDWRFANRVATRSNAIRRLCQIGINLDEMSDDLQSSALHGAQAYLSVLDRLKHALNDDSKSSDDRAKECVLIAAELIQPLQTLAKAALEVTQLTRPFRDGTFREASESARQFREVMDEVSQGSQIDKKLYLDLLALWASLEETIRTATNGTHGDDVTANFETLVTSGRIPESARPAFLTAKQLRDKVAHLGPLTTEDRKRVENYRELIDSIVKELDRSKTVRS